MAASLPAAAGDPRGTSLRGPAREHGGEARLTRARYERHRPDAETRNADIAAADPLARRDLGSLNLEQIQRDE
jgi:hypothetical protein